MEIAEPHKAKVHSIKCIDPFFTECKLGIKPFEVRKDDRNYQVNEYLELRKFDPERQAYVKGENPVLGRITYKLSGGKFGIEKGYCVLGMDWDSIFSKPLVAERKY